MEPRGGGTMRMLRRHVLQRHDIDIQSLAFGMTMLASACINNVFVSYYFEMFTAVAGVTGGWFFAGQVVFCIWNCANDILFGWLSDRARCFPSWCGADISGIGVSDPTHAKVHPTGLLRRLLAIQYGGPLWVLAFIFVFWWPFNPSLTTATPTGLYCMLALCFYDGMLTFVELNHAALLADMTTSSADRAQANMYSSVCAAVGSMSSFFARLFWAPEDLVPFRYFCVALGGISLLGFQFTVRCIGAREKNKNDRSATVTVSSGNDSGNQVSTVTAVRAGDANDIAESESTVGFQAFVRQLSSHRNFKLFCVFNLLQVFDCTFEKNFLSVFLRHFAGTSLSSASQSTVVSLSFVLPWLGTVFVTPVVKRIGVHETVTRILKIRVAIAAIGAILAVVMKRSSWMFLLINRVSSECVCRLIPLIISDLTDEDVHLNRRKASLSASIIGSSGMVGKIGQSVAPMLGYALFASTMRACEEDNEDGFGCRETYGLLVVPTLIAAVPLVVVVCQIFLWRRYTLRGKYLEAVKDSRNMSAKLASV